MLVHVRVCLSVCVYMYMGFCGSSAVNSPPKCKSCEFDPCVGKISWRRKWQPIPAFLPGKSHGQRSLPGYSPWGHKELDVTKHACTQLCIYKCSLTNRIFN